MVRSRRGFAPALGAFAIILLLVLGALPSTGARRPSGSEERATAAGPNIATGPSGLPTALAQPWAARAGFMPGLSSEVTHVVPFTGTAEVSLALWPTHLDLFDPGTAPALSSSAFRAEYSPSVSNYSMLAQYLRGEGLSVVHTFSDRMALSVSGPAADLERAFGVPLDEGTFAGQSVRFPTAAPSLPAPLESMVAAVSGLSDGFTRFTLPLSRLPLPATGAPGTGPAPAQGRTANLVTPNAVHEIYELDGLYNYSGTSHLATNQAIALVLWGEGFDPSDISTFYSQYYPSEFPSPQVVPVPVDGANSPSAAAVTDPSLAPLEMTLDLEYSGSLAPGATLYAVYAPDGPKSDGYSPSDTSLEDALNTAINETGVHVVSMSFATSDGADTAFQASFVDAMASALRMGITPVAASGDNGGDTNPKAACTGVVQPEFPAASPLVLAAGGTAPVLSLSITGGLTGLDSEPAWKGSGGGFALDYPAPSWQLVGSAAPIIQGHGRGIPDVAAPAAYNFLYFGGQPGAGNGTSFAAPIWAGIIAEMDAVRGSPFGDLNKRLYAIGAAEPSGSVAQGLVDITDGANCLGPATKGWDTASGWGSPRAGLLYEDLSGSYVNVSLSPSASAVAPGGSVSAIVSVSNASSHAAIANVTVNLSLTAPGYAGPCGGTLALASGVTNATGGLSVPLAVPACYFGTHATITASVLSRGLFGTNVTTISVNLFGFAGFLAFLQFYPYNLLVFAVIMVVATTVGWTLGTRRRRRRLARAALAQAAQGPPAAPPAAPGAAPAGTTAAARAPASEEASLEAELAAVAPIPPAAPAAEVDCPVCGFHFRPDLGFCPRCGNWLPGREPKGPAS